MNLDELIKSIRRVSEEEFAQKLADHIQDWKTDERNVRELRNSVERYLGNAWIDNQLDFEEIYGIWTEFRVSVIDGIGGMTMNERLYLFGLFELFDKTFNQDEQKKIYTKLMARK